MATFSHQLLLMKLTGDVNPILHKGGGGGDGIFFLRPSLLTLEKTVLPGGLHLSDTTYSFV